MLKTLHLVGDSQDWEALWTSRPVCFSLHHMGTSLPEAPPIEPTPQVSPFSPAWALRLRRQVESREITQSLASRTLNSSPSWNVAESSCPSAWGFSLRTVLLLMCHPPGPLASPSVALHGQPRPQMCAQRTGTTGWCLGPWGSPTPRVSHDSSWSGTLQRRTQSCLGSARGVGSGANQKLGKLIWAFLLGRGQRTSSDLCVPWPTAHGYAGGVSGANLQPVHHSQSCTFCCGLSPPGRDAISNSHQGTIWASSRHGSLNDGPVPHPP